MRFRAYHQIIILLLWALPAVGADTFVGMRPYGASDIGTLRSNDSIVVDRIDLDTQKKTTPAGITSYVQNALSGVLAPASHVHPFANTSSATGGFMSASDKTQMAADTARIDALYSAETPNSAREGAIGDGNWHSLASAGYTVASAQARWPYLTSDGTLTGTHLITTTSNLTSYGVDWAAIQSCVNKGYTLGVGMCIVSGGNPVVERSIVVSHDGFTLRGAGRNITDITNNSTLYYSHKAIVHIPSSVDNVVIENMTISGNSVSSYGIGITVGDAVETPSNQFELYVNYSPIIRAVDFWFLDEAILSNTAVFFNFYDNHFQVTGIGVHVKNYANSDAGDSTIHSSYCRGSQEACIKYESSSGLRISNNKFVTGGTYGIWVKRDSLPGAWSVLLINNNSIENMQTGIYVENSMARVIITGNEVVTSSNTLVLNGISRLTISGNNIGGGYTNAKLVELKNCTDVFVGDNVIEPSYSSSTGVHATNTTGMIGINHVSIGTKYNVVSGSMTIYENHTH